MEAYLEIILAGVGAVGAIIAGLLGVIAFFARRYVISIDGRLEKIETHLVSHIAEEHELLTDTRERVIAIEAAYDRKHDGRLKAVRVPAAGD